MERRRFLSCSCVVGFGILIAILVAKISISQGEELDMGIRIPPNSRTPLISKLESMKKLELKKGDTHALLPDIKLQLYRLGYIEGNAGADDGLFDERLEAGLRLYQSSFNLPVTGFLDGPTIHSLSLPRCGREDVRGGAALMLLPRKQWMAGQWNLIAGQKKWTSSSNLTYAFSSTIGSVQSPILSEQDIRSAMAAAFYTWAAVVPLSFKEVDSFEDAMIKIEFLEGEHGDGWAFDGVLGILSHAFAPEDGRFHLDRAEIWTVSLQRTSSSDAVDLQTVALHEIGHLLGLDHSNVPHSIMFPSLPPRVVRRFLSEDDTMGAAALYGNPPPGPPLFSSQPQSCSHCSAFILILVFLSILLS
ncbi:hypothetical protein SUGI_0933040 [Cryptomeria japonica]|uniref:metalloendoproteinase 1-MMP n=1 Tax=Cryptomeria japonica TaxID=3369 RepID=UPI002414C0A2|nr:metalloendoproteinase 1-MMP [Cryptomeria japonica]GLJ44467.1 hypothetical protein SUGI_0933040 [Cryptomeria japonica]